ncbi:hypothetical protein INT43_004193 [Umbelopsis isabellina]|uniref:Gem-associated protein 2 n=1 Tax=Mortierella isabellina TaxID=91625 RepID=A0A8H7UBU2_MORIS|nr:hypothetical protein INT43_004193 [Umbelopsis isabellina]
MASHRIKTRSATSDDDADYTGKSILPVNSSKDIDDDFIPTTGEDYLLMVRRQTRKVPAVVVAKPPPAKEKFSTANLPSEYRFRTEHDSTTVENLLPKEAWRLTFIKRFEAVKESLSRQSKLPTTFTKLPHKNDRIQWYRFLYGTDGHTAEAEPISGHAPDVSIIQRISQDLSLKLLFYHIEWLEDSTFTSKQATWLWALLTRLDKVMTSDQLSMLRDVSRKFISMRQVHQDPLDPQVIYLNILITIVAKHFGQADLL